MVVQAGLGFDVDTGVTLCLTVAAEVAVEVAAEVLAEVAGGLGYHSQIWLVVPVV